MQHQDHVQHDVRSHESLLRKVYASSNELFVRSMRQLYDDLLEDEKVGAVPTGVAKNVLGNECFYDAMLALDHMPGHEFKAIVNGFDKALH